MQDRVLEERGNALEEEFFRKQNQAIIDRLRAGKAEEEVRQQLTAAIGSSDTTLVEQLLALGVTPASLAAVGLAPLVLVAWADRSLESSERKAVLQEAASIGIRAGTPESELLDGWLQQQPPSSLLETWSAYARGIAAGLDEHGREQFRDSLLNRMRAIANAAGGFAGFGRVSGPEQAVLDAVADALA